MRALTMDELTFVSGGDEPGSGGTTIPNPFPGDYGPPAPDSGAGSYSVYPGGSYDPGWAGSGSGWGVTYGNITISPGNDYAPPIGGDGVIVRAPNGVQVGVSTNEDGDPNGVKVTKPI